MQQVTLGSSITQAEPSYVGPLAPRIALGARLRHLREARGISRESAGHVIRASSSKISRLELGQVRIRERDVADLLTLYRVSGDQERSTYLDLARQGSASGWWQQYGHSVPDWFDTYVGLEQATSVIRGYELQFVPGLLQTPDYARAVIRLGHLTDDDVEKRVELRLRRQELLTGPAAPVVWAVIDEAVLRRPMTDRALFRAQLTHLITQSQRPNVRLQIASLDRGGHAAAGGSFSLLRFAQPDLPDIVYIEQLTTALYLDKRDDVEHYAAVMDKLCTQAEPVDRSAALLETIRAEL